MKDLKIRNYKPGDQTQIIQLFQQVFRKPMGKTESIKHWNWEYKNNPNNQIHAFLAFDVDRLVGYYAVIPIKMKIKDKVYITSLSLDTMTHKDYRGQGLFPTLATKLYNKLGETGISITYGFPNGNSIYGFIKKLEWFEISNVPIYALPLNFISLINRFIKLKAFSKFFGTVFNFIFNLFLKKKKPPNHIQIEKIKEFDERFDEFWELVKNEILIGVIRDSKYLNWRYFQKPEEKYNGLVIKDNGVLKGYIILKIEERYNLKVGLIMDIITDPSNISYQNYLINYAIFYFKNRNVDIVSIIMFPHWRYHNTLRRNMFIKMLRVLSPENIFFGARITCEDFDVQLIKNAKNWFLTWGDTDVV